jgi:hypothetical protein
VSWIDRAAEDRNVAGARIDPAPGAMVPGRQLATTTAGGARHSRRVLGASGGGRGERGVTASPGREQAPADDRCT